MAIAYHVVTNFNTLLRQMIRLSEGLGPQPYNLRDNTITYGYGYTFLRRSGNKWGYIPTWTTTWLRLGLS